MNFDQVRASALTQRIPSLEKKKEKRRVCVHDCLVQIIAITCITFIATTRQYLCMLRLMSTDDDFVSKRQYKILTFCVSSINRPITSFNDFSLGARLVVLTHTLMNEL